MAQAPNRKSGIRRRRAREARRLIRDRKIYRFLRGRVVSGETWHQNLREEIEPLSVYVGKPGHRFNRVLAPFPKPNQPNGKPMPAWKDLSAWMKVQIVTAAFNQWTFLTFNIGIHPDLEQRWLADGKDIRATMRDRVRRELDKAVGQGREFFFVLEGWSTWTKEPTKLHVHGGVAIYEPGDDESLETAVARAAGHGLKGYSKVNRAIHSEIFKRERAGYATYLFKSARRHDDRMPERRLTMSTSATAAGRELWDTITGRAVG